jgi:hypothetical protein
MTSTLLKGSFGSVASLIAATLYQGNPVFIFSLDIFCLPIKQTKWIRHKLNKLMKSSPNYNMLQ